MYDRKRQAIVILVSYYPHYKESALKYSADILSKISDKVKICVVYNTVGARSQTTQYDHFIDFELEGSNKGWEFSAWDEGLAHVRQQINIVDDDVLIFANDTFCHHWPFSSLNVNFISQAINRASFGEVVGDIKHFKQTIQLNQVTGDAWMASYLLAIHMKDIGLLLPFDKIGCDDDFKASILVNHGKVEFARSCAEIQNHLSTYMFPTKQGKGWYNASCKNPELIKLKVIAILNEILLSITCVQRGGKLVSFHPQKWMRSLNRFRRKWMAFKRKLS
ncbi:hypothetical protein [Shewanella sp. S23-S33]|uniref:hypothetical protein n=1 Tax=Shewanella TaxID=22 RepID=UPI00372D4B7E